MLKFENNQTDKPINCIEGGKYVGSGIPFKLNFINFIAMANSRRSNFPSWVKSARDLLQKLVYLKANTKIITLITWF